jgi:hypothetical protein
LDFDNFGCATSMAGVIEDEEDAGSVLGQGDHSGGTGSEKEGPSDCKTWFQSYLIVFA